MELLRWKRALVEELRVLRREPGPAPGRAAEVEAELRRLEGELAKARRRRMILLGHQEE